MDRGLNEAFAPTREQQQQQTKSQKQQQQQKIPLTLRPSTKKTISQPADFFISARLQTIGNLQAKYRAQPSWYSPQP